MLSLSKANTVPRQRKAPEPAGVIQQRKERRITWVLHQRKPHLPRAAELITLRFLATAIPAPPAHGEKRERHTQRASIRDAPFPLQRGPGESSP